MTEDEARDVMLEALAEVAPEIDPEVIDQDEDLIEQLDIDSMDFLNVMLAVNRRTGIEIPERDYPQLSTLKGAMAYLAAAG